jgi:hypothetical protein
LGVRDAGTQQEASRGNDLLRDGPFHDISGIFLR